MARIEVYEIFRKGDNPIRALQKLLFMKPEYVIPVEDDDLNRMTHDAREYFDTLDGLQNTSHVVLNSRELDLLREVK